VVSDAGTGKRIVILKTYARPHIGKQDIDDISTEDILNILKPIWTTKTETAKQKPTPWSPLSRSFKFLYK